MNTSRLNLFSTHYHELTSLDKNLTNLKNIHVSAYEEEGELVFLHQVKDGAVDKSYGIHVAKLANLPAPLIKRAHHILKGYENNNNGLTKTNQITFNLEPPFKASEPSLIEQELQTLNPTIILVEVLRTI